MQNPANSDARGEQKRPELWGADPVTPQHYSPRRAYQPQPPSPAASAGQIRTCLRCFSVATRLAWRAIPLNSRPCRNGDHVSARHGSRRNGRVLAKCRVNYSLGCGLFSRGCRCACSDRGRAHTALVAARPLVLGSPARQRAQPRNCPSSTLRAERKDVCRKETRAEGGLPAGYLHGDRALDDHQEVGYARHCLTPRGAHRVLKKRCGVLGGVMFAATDRRCMQAIS